MNFYNKLFAGTYLYLIKVENRGKIEFSGYFAYSTLLALTFFHMIFLGGAIVLMQQPQLLLNAWVNIAAGLFLFFNGCFLFIRKNRYETVVRCYLKEKNDTIVLAMIVNILMLSTLIIAGMIAVYRN